MNSFSLSARRTMLLLPLVVLNGVVPQKDYRSLVKSTRVVWSSGWPCLLRVASSEVGGGLLLIREKPSKKTKRKKKQQVRKLRFLGANGQDWGRQSGLNRTKLWACNELLRQGMNKTSSSNFFFFTITRSKKLHTMPLRSIMMMRLIPGCLWSDSSLYRAIG